MSVEWCEVCGVRCVVRGSSLARNDMCDIGYQKTTIEGVTLPSCSSCECAEEILSAFLKTLSGHSVARQNQALVN